MTKINKIPDSIEVPGNLPPLAGRITSIIQTARKRVQSVVDHEMVRAYWKIGREIVEDEQQGEQRAEYGNFDTKPCIRINSAAWQGVYCKQSVGYATFLPQLSNSARAAR